MKIIETIKNLGSIADAYGYAGDITNEKAYRDMAKSIDDLLNLPSTNKSDMKSTRGPWKASLSPENQLFKKDRIEVVAASIYDEKGIIGEVWTRNNYEETQANARLIATAPDLLEACWEAYQLLFDEYGNSEHPGVMNILTQAIVKAERRSE